jgi:YidC/Oxa1 family membrane protein insertase
VDLLTILRDIFYLPIFNVLMFLFWLVRDFGLSIVLLTIMVRMALVPLTFKQLRSQRRMMELQPQLNALKAQYGDDKQGFARAQMQFMKENNVSMLGGCLPLLVQLPFLYGLFYALSSGVRSNPGETIAQHVQRMNGDLYPFMHFASVTLPGGLHPLNTLLEWFSWLPGHPVLDLSLADPTHILPILAALFTFIQVRMIQGVRKPPQLEPGADPKKVAQANVQQQTMSLMTYITPFFTLFIAWQYAAGLSLYWVVGTLFAVGQQYVIYGWGSLFKGIPRLDEWAAKKNAEREARREAKLIAKGVISAPTVVESSLVSKNGAAKNAGGGGRRKDWIDQAKGETEQASRGKERAQSARPFPSLMKPKESPATANPPKAAPPAPNGAANGSKTDTKTSAGVGTAPKGGGPTTPPRAGGAPHNQRRGQSRSGNIPRPKGGKK